MTRCDSAESPRDEPAVGARQRLQGGQCVPRGGSRRQQVIRVDRVVGRDVPRGPERPGGIRRSPRCLERNPVEQVEIRAVRFQAGRLFNLVERVGEPAPLQVHAAEGETCRGGRRRIGRTPLRLHPCFESSNRPVPAVKAGRPSCRAPPPAAHPRRQTSRWRLRSARQDHRRKPPSARSQEGATTTAPRRRRATPGGATAGWPGAAPCSRLAAG